MEPGKDQGRVGAEALRRSEELFRLLVESVRDYAIFLLDPDGRVATWNAGAELIKGYTADEILGKHFSTFYPPEVVERGWPQEELRLATANGRVEDEGWRLRKDGTRFWANVVITALRDEDGELLGFAKVTRDLTDRRAAEEQARNLARAEAAREEAEAHVGRLQAARAEADRAREEAERAREEAEGAREEAERARREAEEASTAKSQFLAVMSHELRTPLNAILGFADLLATGISGTVSPVQVGHLERIQEAAWHLLELIDQILSLSRIEAGHDDLDLEALDLGALTRQTALLLQPAAERKELRLLVDTPDEPLEMKTDAGKVRQILLNLLGNAIKFTDEGSVGVRVTDAGDEAELSVWDTGIGIPAEDAERIFELFTQVEPASSRGRGGTGLGLTVTRRLARILGGDVVLESQPGEGSTFIVRLPLDRDHRDG